MSAQGSPRLSVVVLTRNRRKALERCLRSLAAQEFSDFEVVVVDTGSTDTTRAWLADQIIVKRLTVVETDGTGSFAEARNLGIDAAAGEGIAFLDDDCEAHPGWLQRIDQNLRSVDAVGGRTVPPTWIPFPWWWDARMGWAVGLQTPAHADPELAGSLAYPDTSNMAVRREVLRREPFQVVGGTLDGSQRIYQWGREDAELWRRLRLRGHRTRFDPEQSLTHHIDASRLRLRYLFPRAWRDGASLWNRERDETHLPRALDDIFWFPERCVRALFQPPGRWIPSMLAHALWAWRQWGFAHAAWRSLGTWKVARAKLGAIRRYAVSLAKRLMRPILWLACRLLRLSLWKPLPREPRRIALACQGFLGDTVLLGPLLTALGDRFPSAELVLITNRFGRELQGHHPAVGEIIEISPPRFLFGWERFKELRRAMRALKADLVLVPYWHGTSAWPLLMSHRAPVVGFDQDVGFRRRLWHDLLDRRVKKGMRRHEMENLLALAAAAGASIERPTGYHLPPLDEPTPWLAEQVRRHGLPEAGLIALHIGATGEGKAWPPDRWASLVRRVRERWPARRVVFIGHAALRPAVARLIEGESLHAVNLCAERPMADLAALLRRCDLLVTTDSGPKHLAMALGVSTVALYAHSSPERWGAWCSREKHRAVQSPGWNLRPEELGPRSPDHKMTLISVEMVFYAVSDCLAAAAGDPPSA